MVPEGWTKHTVDNLFDVQLGKMLNKAAKERSPQEPYLTNFNVRWGTFDTSKLNSMFFSDKDKDKFSLKAGDLLVCEGGEVGRCAIWGNEVVPCYYQKALHRLRSKGQVVPKYFQSYMEHIAGTKNLDNFTSRTSIAHLTREKFVKLPISLPPLPEQTKIAQILSTWDKAIATTEQLLSNSQQQKKALMQKLLTGKKRFPGFEGEWTQFRLGAIFKERVETNFIDLSLISITAEHGVISRDEVGRKDTSNADKSKYRRICPADIGYNTMRMWQGVSGLSGKEGIVSPAYTILVPQEQVDPLYASYLFKSPELIHVFYRHSQGLVSDTWNLKYKAFSKIKWCFPAINEQREIASILSVSDSETKVLQQNLSYLKKEKKALMQQLLTGKRRVKINV